MKLKEGFILRTVAGRTVVLPVGDGMNRDVMIALNSTGCFLWELLEKGATREELIDALAVEYGVDKSVVSADVDVFVEKLNKHKILDEQD